MKVRVHLKRTPTGSSAEFTMTEIEPTIMAAARANMAEYLLQKPFIVKVAETPNGLFVQTNRDFDKDAEHARSVLKPHAALAEGGSILDFSVSEHELWTTVDYPHLKFFSEM